MPRLIPFFALFVALAPACTTESTVIDAGHEHDASIAIDARTSYPDAASDRDTGPSHSMDASATPDAQSVDSGTIEDSPITDRFRPLATSFEMERMRFGAPGAALLILEHGEVTFARGFGTKHPAMPDPVHASTLFRIGSVTKALTASVLLQLVPTGTVTLDAPITQLIRGFAFTHDPTWAPSITVRDLLMHASGIVDYIDLECSHDDASLGTYLMSTFANQAYLMDPAGRMFNYSNPNFAVAGLIVERRSGLKYREALKTRLFDPLGMHRTFFLGEEAISDGDYAFGVVTDTSTTGQRHIVGPASYDCAWVRPAGYAFSSVRDLAKFVLFLVKGDDRVLASALREQMTSAQIDTKELLDLIHYGYGVSVYDGLFIGQGFYRMKVLNHSGAIDGYSADWWYFPSLDLGYITLANIDGAYFSDTLDVALQSLATLPAPGPAPDLRVDPATFGKYTGTYQDDFNVGRIQVTLTSTTLTVSMPDLDAQSVPYQPRLEPDSPDNFILTIEGDQVGVTFILDALGNGEYFRTRPFVGRKVQMFHRNIATPMVIDRAALERRLKSVRAFEPREDRRFRVARKPPSRNVPW